MALPFQSLDASDPAVESADAGLVASIRAARVERPLDALMRQAFEVPGAASALLEAFAAQSRALRLVQEADARGAASLPGELRDRLAAAVERTPSWLVTIR